MLLTIEKHQAYKVYNKEGDRVPYLQEFNTKNCVAKQVRLVDGKPVLDKNSELIIDIITIEGGYATDPQGNRVV